MSRNLRFGALLLGMALALSGCGDKAPAPGGGGAGAGGGGGAGAGGGGAVRLAPPVADELARLVPANAFGVVYAPSIDKLIAKLKSVVVAIDAQAAQGIDAGPLLEQLAGPAAPHVDTSRPMAIVLTPGPGKDDPPSPTFLLPVRDGAAAKASFGEMPPGASGPVVVGSYLALSQGPGFQAGTAPSALVKDLPAGDLVVRLDLARVVETYRPMIDEAMGQVSKSLPDAGSEPGGPGQVTGLESMKPMLEGLTGAMKTFLDSAERLDLGLRLDGGKASFDLRFLAKTGSALDRPKSARGDVAALAASLPADYPVVVLLGGGLREMTEWSMKMSDMTFAALPEAQRSAFKGLMSRSKDMMDLIGDEMAIAFRMGDAGFEMVEIVSAKDGKAYLAKMDEMFRSQGDALAAMGATVETLPPSTTAGVDVREWSMAFDFDKLTAMNAGTTGQDPAKSEAARKAMQAMFGSGKLRARAAAVGNRVVIAMGGADDLMGKALAAVKAPGKPSATLASALSAAGARPTFVVSLEMRELVGGVLNLMGKVMPASADKPPPTMPAGGPVHVMAYGTMEGREYAGTFSADVSAAAELIKGLVEQMKPTAVEVPPPDDK